MPHMHSFWQFVPFSISFFLFLLDKQSYKERKETSNHPWWITKMITNQPKDQWFDPTPRYCWTQKTNNILPNRDLRHNQIIFKFWCSFAQIKSRKRMVSVTLWKLVSNPWKPDYLVPQTPQKSPSYGPPEQLLGLLKRMMHKGDYLSG